MAVPFQETISKCSVSWRVYFANSFFNSRGCERQYCGGASICAPSSAAACQGQRGSYSMPRARAIRSILPDVRMASKLSVRILSCVCYRVFGTTFYWPELNWQISLPVGLFEYLQQVSTHGNWYFLSMRWCLITMPSPKAN